jgi:hypothetical protein
LGIALLIWLYKKEEYSRATLHARGGRPDGPNKLAESGKQSGGDNPLKEDKPPERDKLPRKDKPSKEDNLLKGDKPVEEDKLPAEEEKPPQKDKPAEGHKPPQKDKPAEGDKPVEEDKPPQKDKPAEGDKHVEEDMPLGGVEHLSIPEIPKVMVVEQNPIVPKCCGPSTCTKRCHPFRFAMDANATKARSIFMKEYQKVPRVGAFAYKYFTSRDKKIRKPFSYMTFGTWVVIILKGTLLPYKEFKRNLSF